MVEIERKFLVADDRYKSTATSKHQISQGYLNTDPARTVRIRIADDKGYITIKGKGSESGMTRFEWEQEIAYADATALLALCENVVEKVRYRVSAGKHTFEVDEFLGDNSGLILAEVELAAEDERYEVPVWLGKEVTSDKRYYNSYLSTIPFCTW